MTSAPELPPIGYDAWRSAHCVVAYSAEHDRLLDFIQGINWGAVIEQCYSLSGGEPCVISEKYTLGRWNLIRQVIFRNGTIWVVRLRLPEPGTSNEVPSVTMCYESLKYLRDETTIPVPEVYQCDASLTNKIGAPYIIMEYIRGTTADSLRKALGRDSYEFGTHTQDLNFRKELAMIQVKLANKKFDRIGRPRLAANGEYKVETSATEHTFTSDHEYYKRMAEVAIRESASRTSSDSHDPMVLIPTNFNTLMTRWSTHLGPFGLTIASLGAKNVLVNENFEVQAVIDPEGLMAVPIEIQAQLPYLMDLQMSPPSYTACLPMEKLKFHNTLQRVKEYRSFLKDAHRQTNTNSQDTGDAGPLYKAVLSPAAIVYQGITEYRGFGKKVNPEWLVTYSELASDSQLPVLEARQVLPSSYIFADSDDED